MNGSSVTLRNAISNARQEIEIAAGQTVRQAVEQSGFVAAGSSFSVRDKNGQVVDEQMADGYTNQVLSVGLPGDEVRGGARSSRRDR